jgi:hypothetical protein
MLVAWFVIPFSFLAISAICSYWCCPLLIRTISSNSLHWQLILTNDGVWRQSEYWVVAVVLSIYSAYYPVNFLQVQDWAGVGIVLTHLGYFPLALLQEWSRAAIVQQHSKRHIFSLDPKSLEWNTLMLWSSHYNVCSGKSIHHFFLNSFLSTALWAQIHRMRNSINICVWKRKIFRNG